MTLQPLFQITLYMMPPRCLVSAIVCRPRKAIEPAQWSLDLGAGSARPAGPRRPALPYLTLSSRQRDMGNSDAAMYAFKPGSFSL